MKKLIEKAKKRQQRKLRIRSKVSGTPEIPRMSVYKSNKHMYVQVIDDVNSTTIIAASDLEADLKDLKKNVEGAAKLGEALGKKLLDKNIKKVVFDRNGFLYHGVLKAIADGTRKAGIEL